MRGIKALLMVPVLGTLLLAGACTGNALDDNSAADVALQIIGFTTPPVTAAVSTTGFCSTTTSLGCTQDTDCPLAEVCIIGGCTLTVVDWTASMGSVPVNSLAQPPFNDIAMIDVTVTYNFPVSNPAPRTFGLGGIVVPTGGSAGVTFPPIALQDLNASHEGTTGGLVLDFRGQTLEGTPVMLSVGQNLSVEVCQ